MSLSSELVFGAESFGCADRTIWGTLRTVEEAANISGCIQISQGCLARRMLFTECPASYISHCCTESSDKKPPCKHTCSET